MENLAGNRWWVAMARVFGVVLRLELRNDGGSGGNDSRGDIGEGEDGGELLISDVNFTLHSAFILHNMVSYSFASLVKAADSQVHIVLNLSI